MKFTKKLLCTLASLAFMATSAQNVFATEFTVEELEVLPQSTINYNVLLNDINPSLWTSAHGHEILIVLVPNDKVDEFTSSVSNLQYFDLDAIDIQLGDTPSFEELERTRSLLNDNLAYFAEEYGFNSTWTDDATGRIGVGIWPEHYKNFNPDTFLTNSKSIGILSIDNLYFEEKDMTIHFDAPIIVDDTQEEITDIGDFFSPEARVSFNELSFLVGGTYGGQASINYANSTHVWTTGHGFALGELIRINGMLIGSVDRYAFDGYGDSARISLAPGFEYVGVYARDFSTAVLQANTYADTFGVPSRFQGDRRILYNNTTYYSSQYNLTWRDLYEVDVRTVGGDSGGPLMMAGTTIVYGGLHGGPTNNLNISYYTRSAYRA